MFKLTPTGLTFGLNCPRCFVSTVAHGWKQPYQPFPSVFGAIDRCLRGYWHEKGVRPLSVPGLEDCILDCREYRIESMPITLPGHQPFYISGKTDGLIRTASGDLIGVVDFKVSAQLKPEQVDLYRRQMHLYAWGIEHGKTGSKVSGSPNSVRRLGLLTYSPEQLIEPRNLSFRVEWIEVQRDDAWFAQFLGEVLAMLESPSLPMSAPNCPWCVVREGYSQNAKQASSEHS
jgi:PD-(D/E)XK nuclease superfamily